MAEANIFVDPDYPHDVVYEFIGEEYNPLDYQRYLDDLINKWNSSTNPILIRGLLGYRRFLEMTSNKGVIFNGDSFISGLGGGGEVHRSDWERYKSYLIDTGIIKCDEIRIHGATYGGCVDNVAFQLYGLLYEGAHWIKQRLSPSSYTQEEFEKHLDLERVGAFRKSKIRYGIVHKAPDYLALVTPTPSFPFGRLPFQFTDERTRIVEFSPIS